MEQLEKDPSNFSKGKKEQLKFEQKSIEIDAFHKLEEETIKEKIEKRRQQRPELVEKKKNKVLNWKKKEQEKTEEEQFWDKLTTLNKEIRVIGNIK